MFPFQFDLPADLPSSFHEKNEGLGDHVTAVIKYKVKAEALTEKAKMKFTKELIIR